MCSNEEKLTNSVIWPVSAFVPVKFSTMASLMSHPYSLLNHARARSEVSSPDADTLILYLWLLT